MKSKFLKKVVSLGVCGAMAVGMLTGCGSGASADTSYTMWLYSGADASYYTDFADNPVIQYLTSKTWGEEDKKIDLEFWVPASGTATDSYSTMIGSGDYPDILDASIADSPINMYNDGIAMDLTDLVKKYMPNYVKYLDEHPVVRSYAVTEVDGEEKYLNIISANEGYDYVFCGYQYRRDWIVKYGTNPSTGAKFTGGYTDADDLDSWEDDVKFPSWYNEDLKNKYLAIDPDWDGSDPAYISDWEWMFGIFEKAYADLGIDDSYSISMYYSGYTWTGDLCSCFGGGNFAFSLAADGKTMQYGGVEDTARAYLQCMNNWYEKGWLDQTFNERTSDMFYSIDDTAVRQGKVGMWCGVQAELGGRLDTGDAYTDGIYVAGCALPINDVYGTDACKFVVPDCVMIGSSLNGVSYYVTTAAAEKDLGPLLSMFDYLYTDEGARIRTLGLNKEEMEECGTTFYEDYGIGDGMYYEGDDGKYHWVDAVLNDNGSLKEAGQALKIPGVTLVDSIDAGYAEAYEHSLKEWIKFKNTAQTQGTPVTNNMTKDEATLLANTQTKLLNYTESNAVKFIKGDLDINDDAAWDTWCKALKKFNYDKVLKIYQPYADQYPISFDDSEE